MIEFTVSVDVTAKFRKAALAADVKWKPLLRKRLHQKADGTIREEFEDIGQEYAEVA